MEIHLSVRKDGIADEDIAHAMTQAMAIEDQVTMRGCTSGRAATPTMLEIVTIVRDDGSELAIHAMALRAKYQRLMPGG